MVQEVRLKEFQTLTVLPAEFFTALAPLLGLCYPDGAGSQSSSEVALADVDGSGDVGVNDLLLLLSAFGREGDVNACDVEGDIDGDCGVHAAPPALIRTLPRPEWQHLFITSLEGVRRWGWTSACT